MADRRHAILAFVDEVGFLKRFVDVAGGRFLAGDLIIFLTSRNGFPVGLIELIRGRPANGQSDSTTDMRATPTHYGAGTHRIH